jgi:hypothetical protein
MVGPFIPDTTPIRPMPGACVSWAATPERRRPVCRVRLSGKPAAQAGATASTPTRTTTIPASLRLWLCRISRNPAHNTKRCLTRPRVCILHFLIPSS